MSNEDILTGSSEPGAEHCAACNKLLIDGVGLRRMPVAPYAYVLGYEKIISQVPHPDGSGQVTTVTAHPICCAKPACLKRVIEKWPQVDIDARRAATIEAIAKMVADTEKYDAENAPVRERRDAASQKLQAAWVNAGAVLGFEPGARGFTNLLNALVGLVGGVADTTVLEELRLATLEYEGTWQVQPLEVAHAEERPSVGELTAAGLCTVGMHPEPLPAVTHAVTIRDGSIPMFKCCATCATAYAEENGADVTIEKLPAEHPLARGGLDKYE